MPPARLNASAMDYSLLAGAEALSVSVLDAVSSTSSDDESSGSSLARTSDEEEEEAGVPRRANVPVAQAAPKTPEMRFRVPKKVSQVRLLLLSRLRTLGADPRDRSFDAVQDPNDWLWMHDEEPHRSRRRAILKAHPEVGRLLLS